jgi:arylsulfatase A-like enzyme
MKKIKTFLFATLAIVSIVNVSAQSKKKQFKNQDKPNIIFILADDLGIGNVGCYGADNFKTPNIDQLAKEGIQFNHAFTAPLCGPSRALIMTGRYAYRTGATNQDATAQMKPEVEVMIPKILKSAGYVTSCVGKWGQLPLGPAEFGFDDYLRYYGSGVYWYNGEKKIPYKENGEDKLLNGNEYMPDLMHNHLMKFITDNKNKPFYAYYSLSHVHGEIVATPDSKSEVQEPLSLFTDNINYMDKLVGKLIHSLDSLHLREKTMIVFMGDNGTAANWYTKSTINGRMLSGKKGEMKECGGLVPMLINWPSVVAPQNSSNQLIDASDFVPTLAEIAGAKLPNGVTLDGKSFANQIMGKNGPQRDWIFVELGNKWYVRDNQWKLNNNNELFDMSNAPFEEKLIDDSNKTPESTAAFKKLSGILAQLNPAGGILDNGDGSGRHGNKSKKKKEGKDKEEKNKDDKEKEGKKKSEKEEE